MKKIIYLFFLITFAFLTGCSGRSDDPDDPIPPTPPIELDEDAILGTWETYYLEKQIVVNPGQTNVSNYGGLRQIDYDGFRTVFVKEGGRYKTKDYNLAGNLAFEADYHIKDDTIKFERQVQTEDGRDSIAKTWQRIREFTPAKGVLKLDQSYYGFTSQDDTRYKITDVKGARNVLTAPTTTDGVTPAKVMVDYDNLCDGKWQIYMFRYYEDGVLNRRYSEVMTDTLSTISYDFYLNNKGDKRCVMKEWDFSAKKEIIRDFPVLLIDDVIHLLYKEQVFDKDKNPVYDEGGKPVYKDESLFMWVTSWQKRDGVDTFIDFGESRYEENVKVIIKTQIYLKRVYDS